MSTYTRPVSDEIAVAATIDPGSLAAQAHSTDGIDMQDFQRAMFIVLIGTLGTAATVDFKLQGSADNSSFADLGDAYDITQFTKAGSDDNKQAVVEITAEALMAVDPTYRYVKGVLTIAEAASGACVVGLGTNPRYSPAVNYDLASVDEIVQFN